MTSPCSATPSRARRPRRPCRTRPAARSRSPSATSANEEPTKSCFCASSGAASSSVCDAFAQVAGEDLEQADDRLRQRGDQRVVQLLARSRRRDRASARRLGSVVGAARRELAQQGDDRWTSASRRRSPSRSASARRAARGSPAPRSSLMKLKPASRGRCSISTRRRRSVVVVRVVVGGSSARCAAVQVECLDDALRSIANLRGGRSGTRPPCRCRRPARSASPARPRARPCGPDRAPRGRRPRAGGAPVAPASAATRRPCPAPARGGTGTRARARAWPAGSGPSPRGCRAGGRIGHRRSASLVRREHSFQHSHRELAADHRRDAQAALGVVGQLVDARQQQAVQRVGDLDAGDRLVGRPAVAGRARWRRGSMSMRMTSSTKNGLPSERVRMPSRTVVGQRLDLEQVGDQLAAVALRSAAAAGSRSAASPNVDLRAGVTRRQPGASVSARPAKISQHRQWREQRQQLDEHLDRSRIGPVDVLADEHDRALVA